MPDHKACECSAILRGVKKPQDCKIFGTVYPKNPGGFLHGVFKGACLPLHLRTVQRISRDHFRVTRGTAELPRRLNSRAGRQQPDGVRPARGLPGVSRPQPRVPSVNPGSAVDRRSGRPLAAGGHPALLAVLSVTLVLLGVHRASRDGWIPLVDSANLAFHEASHPIVGAFSDRLAVYGGTMFQLLFPPVVAIPSPAGAKPWSLPWGSSGWAKIFSTSPATCDARAQEVTPGRRGEHDWTEIFLRWGVLQKDVKIASFTRWLGIALMVGAVVGCGGGTATTTGGHVSKGKVRAGYVRPLDINTARWTWRTAPAAGPWPS